MDKELLREQAKNNFKKWYAKDNYLILDTETTGLEDDDEIIEIAVIDLHGKVLINTLVKPMVKPIIFGVNDITYKMLEDAPPWSIVWKNLKKILNDKTILAYNADFDIRMIIQTCSLHDLGFWDFDYECVMKNYAAIHSYYNKKYNDFKWISLENATGVYQKHRALDDCFLVLRLIEEENI